MLKHYLISGRVQGVGYRAFARRAGAEIGLKGWVRNLVDGRVEALVSGDETQHERFMKSLKHGPPSSLVESVTGEVVEGSFVWDDFVIARNGDTEWSHES